MRNKNLILVVDDSPTILHGTCRILQKAGYETIEASTGMDGLRLTIEQKPDLVLLDVVLPDIYGYEVCRRIKEEANLTGTLVILISSLDTDQDHQAHGLEFGADGYITRPVSNRNLLAHVKSLLRLNDAEEKLRQGELKFRTVADFTYDWEYWIAPDGGILYMSPSSKRVTGYRRDEFLDNPKLLTDIIHKDDRFTAEDHFNNIELSGAHIVDFRIITRNGEEQWIAHQCQPIFDDGGKFLGRRVSNRDITERKRTEEALRESEEKFRHIFEKSPLGIIHFDSNGVVTDCNQVFLNIIGSSREQVTGFNLLTSLTNEEVRKGVESALSGKVGRFEGEYISVTGAKHIWVRLLYAPISNAEGSITGGLGIFEDITESERMERTVRESEQRVRAITSSVLDAIIELNNNGEICFWNPASEQIFGYSDAEVMGKNAHELLAPLEYHTAYFTGFKDFAATGQGNAIGKTVELFALRKNGEEFPIELSLAGFLVDGQWHAVGIVRDISERKRMEEERVEMERKLLHAQKVESLAVMAGSIAHDFNNQLAIVLGNLEFALLGLPPDSPARGSMMNAVKAATRSAQLSGQMRTYTGDTFYYPVELDLNELLNKNSNQLRSSLPKNVTLTTEIYNQLEPIRADPDQIQRLVMNILDNAYEAIGDKEGEVLLSTGVIECDEACLMRSRLEEKPKPGRFVLLEVRDTGCGMDSDTQDKLLDPFFTTKFWGRGLGMAEARGIVKGHHGAIIIDSEVGKGTTINVLFPTFKETGKRH